jgi:hypothetical protein
MKTLPTYEVRAYIGSVRGYDGASFSKEDLIGAIGHYQKVAEQGIVMAVRVTPTSFVYQDYVEDGWEIAAINYPRFPKQQGQVDDFMIGLAKYLLNRFEQNRMSVVSPSITVLLECENPEENPKR